MKNPFEEGSNKIPFNPNEYMDINAVFDYGNFTPSGNDKNEKENNIPKINNNNNNNMIRKTMPNYPKNNIENNNNDNNLNNRKTMQINSNENKKKIFEKINEQTILPSNDDDSSDDLLNCSNNNFIVSIIRDLQGDSDKRDISILEDDYINPKIFRFVQIDNIKKILEQANKNKILELKNLIDNYKLTGRNLDLISSLDNLLKKNYDMKNNIMKSVLENLNIYENIIFKWRATKGDKDCYYRSVMFYFIESIILERNIQYFINFFMMFIFVLKKNILLNY